MRRERDYEEEYEDDSYDDEGESPSDELGDDERQMLLGGLNEEEEPEPFDPQQQPTEYQQHNLLFQRFAKKVIDGVQQANWTSETKKTMVKLANQMRFPDVVLANLDKKQRQRFEHMWKIQLITADMLAPRSDRSNSDFLVTRQLMSSHIIFPISRAYGPERERVIYNTQIQRRDASIEQKKAADQPRTLIDKYLGGRK